MVILKKSYYAPPDFGGKSPQNSVSQNGRHRFQTSMNFSFVEILNLSNSSTNVILTNSGMEILFLNFILTIFLTINLRWRPQTTLFRSKFSIFILCDYCD